MQSSMEIEPQNGTVGIGEISKEGYEELYRIGDKLKKETPSFFLILGMIIPYPLQKSNMPACA